MNDVDLEKAMSSIRQNIESQQRERVELATGPAGPRGEKGERGSAGLPATISVGSVSTSDKPSAQLRITDSERNAYELDLFLPKPEKGETGERGMIGKTPRVAVGKVIDGNEAAVSVREENGVNFFDFVLPRGARGATGNRGEQGIPGLAGRDGKNGVDGRDGQDGIGIQGAPGKDGLSEEEIRKIVQSVIIETLQNIGVMGEQARKLVEVRAALKNKLNEVSVRNIAEMADFVKAVDRLF